MFRDSCACDLAPLWTLLISIISDTHTKKKKSRRQLNFLGLSKIYLQKNLLHLYLRKSVSVLWSWHHSGASEKHVSGKGRERLPPSVPSPAQAELHPVGLFTFCAPVPTCPWHLEEQLPASQLSPSSLWHSLIDQSLLICSYLLIRKHLLVE